MNTYTLTDTNVQVVFRFFNRKVFRTSFWNIGSLQVYSESKRNLKHLKSVRLEPDSSSHKSDRVKVKSDYLSRWGTHIYHIFLCHWVPPSNKTEMKFYDRFTDLQILLPHPCLKSANFHREWLRTDTSPPLTFIACGHHFPDNNSFATKWRSLGCNVAW